MKINRFYILFIILIILFSCAKKKQIQQIKEDFATTNIEVNNKEIDSLFYNFPSYNNISSNLDNFFIKFCDTILLPYEKANFYDDTKQSSLLLGMYLADLSYVRHFEKVQLCSNYLDAVKILSDKLAINSEIINELVPKIEENLDNKEYLFHIIDSLLNMGNNIFSNNEIYSINILCITGFWIESTEIAFANDIYGKIHDNIAEEHKNILNVIINILEKTNDNDYIDELYKQIKEVSDSNDIIFIKNHEIRNKYIKI